MERLTVSPSPHISHSDSSRGIMLDVVIALLPLVIAAALMFGFYSLLVVAVSVVTAVLSEYICRRIMKRDNSIGDLSAVVTGIILALNLPPRIPVWIAAIGSIVAIVVVKQMFGGMGHNFANPAMAARIVLLVSFPTAMSTWTAPFGSTEKLVTNATTGTATDLLTTATPLSATAINGGDYLYSYKELFMGQISGCMGETFKLLIIISMLYLVARRVISIVVPVGFVGTVALMSWIFGDDPLYMILSGGLLFGAVFMATDYVTSPINLKGQAIFAVGCGLITFVIRHFGYLPEGVSYAILIMNLLVPYINRLTVPRPFGREGGIK